MAEFLTNMYSEQISDLFPLKKINNNNNSSGVPINWFNNDLKVMRNEVSALKTISSVKRCPLYTRLYKLRYKQYKNAIVNARKIACDLFLSNS